MTSVREENLLLLKDIVNKKKEMSTIIVELSGTPNSGKTTVLSKMANVLKHKNMNYSVIYEGATYCKIENKLSPEFNFCTGTYYMNKLWEKLDKKPEIIICERGIFDALCWLNFHKLRCSLSDDMFETMEKFYLNENILKYPRYVLEMTCSPQMAISREYPINKFEVQGIIVNEKIVSQINRGINLSLEQYSKCFDRIDVLDTSDKALEKTVDLAFNYVFRYLKDTI